MASRFASISRRAIGLSYLDWRYLVIAVKELLIARVRHASRPVGNILRELQYERLQSNCYISDRVDLARLSWAISVAAARVPWRSDCLPQTMAADRWLRRYGMQPKFFVGVAKGEDGKVEAHAWLRCGEVIVTGANGENFTTLIEPVSRPAQE